MMNKIIIRLATIDDLVALEEIGADLFDYPIKPNRTAEFINDPRHHLMLALEKETIVGMASGIHYVHPDKEPALFIDEVSIIDTHQNRGIGRLIVKSLVAHGKKLGCVEAWVAT